MMKLLLFIPLLVLASCGPPGTQDSPPSEVAASVDFDWLIGHWQRSDDKPGRQTYERWKRTTNVLYSGFGYTVAEQDTVWQEDMRIYKREGVWTLEVSGEGEKVPFEIQEVSSTGFTSINPQHDFPQVISYELRGDSLYAVISGEGMEVPFTFGRKE